MLPQSIALSVERSALDAALKKVSDTLSKKPIIPATGFVLAKAIDGELVLRTCDLDRQTIASIPAEIDQPGAVCLPGDAFRNIVSGFALGAQIRLQTDTTTGLCSLASGRSRYRLVTLPANYHPDIGGADGVAFKIPGTVLKRAITRVSFAASTAEDRAFLWGSHLHVADVGGKKKLALVALDGFVVSRCLMDLPAGLDDMPAITIPTEAVNTLAKLAPDSGDIEIIVSPNRIAANVGNVGFVSKLVEGQFPDYPRAIPAISGRGATVDRAALSASLGRFGAIDEKGSALSISPSDASLILSGEHAELGDAREEIEAEIHAVEGLSPFAFAASRKLLASVLSRFTGEHLLLDQSAPDKLIRVMPLSPSDEGHDAALMPMRAAVRQAE